MKARLECIMLVDDSIADNFLHEKLILRMGAASKVVTMRTGHGALDYVASFDKLSPELILLDIDMPVMNGWQFLEEFEKLGDPNRLGKIVIMLESNDGAQAEVGKNPIVKDYILKPLTEEGVEGILNTHFST